MPTNVDLAVIAAGQSATVPGFVVVPTTTVNNDGTGTVTNGGGMGLSGTNTNNGVINLNSAGSNTDLTINGVVTLNGTGSIMMSNTAANRIHGSGSTLNLGAGQSILGSGQLGIGGTLVLNNNGTVSATQSAALTINTSGGVTNNSVLRANGGTLIIVGTNVTQDALGRLDGINGSSVQLQNGTSITGGSFTSSGGGSIDVAGFHTVSLSGVTNAGTFNINNGGGVDLNGALVNNGTVNIASVGSNTDINVTGARTISGTGVINMSNTSANRILGTGTLTLGSGQTLQGSGTIGVTSGFALNNQGTVIATQSAPILINASGGVTNTGTLRADGGTLQLQTTVNSAGGTIEALNGSQVQLLNNAVINSANFSTTGVGSLITTAGFANVTLGGGTVNGAMTVANGSELRLTGDVNYNGVLSMASAGSNTGLDIDGTRSIGGTATINMSNTLANRIRAANGAGDQLTLGNNVTLQGGGSLGAATALAVVNNGTVIATTSPGLQVEASGGVTNNGVMRADGGTLFFRNVALNSAGGTIEAVNGSQVVLENGTSIINANFSASTGGLITTAAFNTVTLGGSTISGPMTMANGSELRLTGDVNYNGVLSMASAGSNTDITFNGARALNGTATLNLSNTTANRLLAATGAGHSVTIGSGITIQGAGSIGAGTQLAVVNNGSLIANQSSGMVLATPVGATNNALIRGDGATFTINTQLTQGASGVLNAINNGAVVLANNSQITGGTFSTASGGEVAVAGFVTARVAGVTNTGTLNIRNGAELILNGTLTNNGSLSLQSVGSNTDLRADGNRSILGTGTITMTNTTANRIFGVAAGDGLTLGAGQTLQGAGSIGGGTHFNFTNQGTVTANLSSPITMSTNASGSLTNAAGGTMQATTGGTLNVNSALSNSGTLAANGGVVNANAAFNGTGTALISGAGQLNVGANSTVGTLTHNGSAANGLALGTNNITVSGDYTNANSGTGNSFNRRANVTGTGQIFAGDNAAQAITGATVTGGNTTNATLTIGNVRVGTTSYDYQIANTGTTGPTLRGAIQTSVNGGNITDARLSGSGVTASNYNTGGPGSNTGDLAVTFTTANAGLLAPLNGQAVNLHSNFANIPDQKLNIVLDAGAAAFNPAAGQINTTNPFNFGTVQVGQNVAQTLSITNIATGPNGFVEDLNASFGATTGIGANRISGTGSISAHVAGATNASNMMVQVDTSTAGTVNGSIAVNFASNGTVNGVSNNLGTLSVGSTNFGVVGTISGQVVDQAQPVINNAPIDLGNIRINTASPTQFVSLTNQATGNPQATLNASISAASPVTASGSFNGLQPGVTNNNSLQVALVTTNAGAITGTATVDLVSDASNIGNCAPNCQLQLPSQDVTVRGNVFRLANPTLNTPAIALAARVGDASPSRALSLSNTSPDQFTEGLNATLGAAPAGFTAQGSLTNLAAGQTNTTALQIALQTGTAGAFSGQTNVTFVSTGQGTTGAPDVGVGNASVTLSGNVYTPAQANVTPTVHFGIVHKDEVVSDRALTVTNAAAVTALNDVLRGGFSGVTGPFTQNGGTLGAGLAAGATDSQSLTVGLLTTTVGAFSGQATLALTSHNDEMADLNLAQVQIALSAQVNNFANPTFVQTGGDGVLSRTGLLYTLDFGTITQQPGSATALLSLLNDVPGDPRFTDLLDGTFEGTVSRFLLSGFQPFVDIQGGSAFAGLSVALDTSVLGRFDERIVLHSFSHNDDFFGALPDVTLAFSGNIVTGGPADPVPEPSTLLLCLSGLLIGAGLRARRRRAGRAPTK